MVCTINAAVIYILCTINAAVIYILCTINAAVIYILCTINAAVIYILCMIREGLVFSNTRSCTQEAEQIPDHRAYVDRCISDIKGKYDAIGVSSCL
jgi:hypothetical protein